MTKRLVLQARRKRKRATMDMGVASEERRGVGGDEELVSKGNEDVEDGQVELKVLEAMRGLKHQGLEGLCEVGL
jgi:hypothetical protein